MSTVHFTDESIFTELEKLGVVKQRTDGNRETALIKKLPKLMIFERIIPFLAISDVNNLAMSCRTLKALVYGPAGLKLITKTRTFESVQFVKNQVIDKIQVIVTEVRPDNENNKIKTPPTISRAERIQHNSYSGPHSRDEPIVQTARSQLDSQNRTPIKRATTFDLQPKADDAELIEIRRENEELKESIKEHKTIIYDLNLKYQNLLAEKEKELIRMYGENNELRAHRKLLAQEVVNLRDSLGKSENEKLKFFDCLISVNKAIE
jgi:hypothetical protein